MADKITMQVARYRPEQESDATMQEYEVPCPKDWVVLDGLNYIKDRLDGSLSFRWSCRMGVCGSCGMTVNGEPKLAVDGKPAVPDQNLAERLMNMRRPIASYIWG